MEHNHFDYGYDGDKKDEENQQNDVEGEQKAKPEEVKKPRKKAFKFDSTYLLD
jgi:hypothetical protein